MLGGRLADLLGRRRLFVAGVTVFTFSSLLSGLAWSEGSLIVFRGLRGLGGALLAPAALSIVVTTFREDVTGTSRSACGVLPRGAAARRACCSEAFVEHRARLRGGHREESKRRRWTPNAGAPACCGSAAVSPMAGREPSGA